MEETLLQEQSQPETTAVTSNEPVQTADNPLEQSSGSVQTEGQSTDPSNLILGKFKSVEDLSKAYQEMEKYQGIRSKELGNLRQNTAMLHNIVNAWEAQAMLEGDAQELQAAAEKYNTPQYFQNPAFKQMYKEAYLALGKNLDSEKFINLLEGYVESRIFAHEKDRAAKSETQKVIDSMTYSKNNSTSLTPPKKRLDEMTPKEVDELLERLI